MPSVTQGQTGFEPIQQGLAQLLAALQHRQDLGLQRQQVELERQRTEASVAQSTQATAESKARTKNQLAELDQREIELRARDFATQQYIAVASSADGVTPQSLSEMRTNIVKTADKDIMQEAAQYFDQLAKFDEEARRAVVERQRSEQALREAEATEAANIQTALLEPEVRREQLQTENLRQAGLESDLRLNLMREALDPARVDRAMALWPATENWGQARKSVGLGPSPEGGIPDDAVFTPTDAATATEQRQKAQNFMQQMVSANAIVNGLVRDKEATDSSGRVRVQRGARISFGTQLQRAAGSNALFSAINSMQSGEQQQLLQAGLQYVMSYRFFMSGQQSSDKEYLNMMKLTLEQVGDSDDTIRQKRLMRQLQINAVNTVASGGASATPLQVLQQTVETAKAEGMSRPFVDALQGELDLARTAAAERAAGRAQSLTVSAEPLDPNAFLERARALLGSLLVDTMTTRLAPSLPASRIP